MRPAALSRTLPSTRLDHFQESLNRPLRQYVDSVAEAIECRDPDRREIECETTRLGSGDPGSTTTRERITVRKIEGDLAIEVELVGEAGRTTIVDARVRRPISEHVSLALSRELARGNAVFAIRALLVLFSGFAVLIMSAWAGLGFWLFVLAIVLAIVLDGRLRRIQEGRRAVEQANQELDEFLEFFGNAGAGAGALVRRRPERALAIPDDTAPAIDRALRDTPRAAIATLGEQGGEEFGKIVGRVRHGTRLLRAPASGRPCAHWEVRVHRAKREGEGWSPWLLVGWYRQREPFFIDDDTGWVRVDPAGAEISVEADDVRESPWAQLPEELRELMEETWSESSDGNPGRDPFPESTRLRVEEGVLEEGELVAAHGRWIFEPDPEAIPELGGYRGQVPARLCLVHVPGSPLRVSDSLLARDE